MNIIHRDVKAANVLCTIDGQVKIGKKKRVNDVTADFGVSQQLNGKVTKVEAAIGTPLWMSPEVILQKPYDDKAHRLYLGNNLVRRLVSRYYLH